MHRLSLILSSLALVAALTGGAAIASQVINGASIKRGSIPADRLTPAARAALKGKTGPRGFDGSPGPPGQSIPGPQGPAGIGGVNGGFDPAKITYVTGGDVSVPVGATMTATAYCPVNTTAIAGGFFSSITHVAYSNGGVASWSVIVNNDTSIPISVHAYAVCSAR